MEERLNSYLNNLSNAVDEVRAGNENVKLPSLDLEAVGILQYVCIKSE
jgi:hypothetical protein